MLEIGQTFMYSEKEYKIIFKNEKKDRLIIQPIVFGDDLIIYPKINEIIEISELDKFERIRFKVSYINEGQKRITLKSIK